jgi:hypothetical protein
MPSRTSPVQAGTDWRVKSAGDTSDLCAGVREKLIGFPQLATGSAAANPELNS